MLKQFTVTFEFDGDTQTVSKIKCFQDGIEQKKPTTRKAPAKKEIVLEDKAIITLESNKLVLNNKAVAVLGLEYQDRVLIKYDKIKGQKLPVPIISKDEDSGNKITKTNTVSYRGTANSVLKEYGEEFTLEEYKPDVWRMISTSTNEVDKYTAILDSVDEQEDDIPLFVEEDDDNFEIEEMTFKL